MEKLQIPEKCYGIFNGVNILDRSGPLHKNRFIKKVGTKNHHTVQ